MAAGKRVFQTEMSTQTDKTSVQLKKTHCTYLNLKEYLAITVSETEFRSYSMRWHLHGIHIQFNTGLIFYNTFIQSGTRQCPLGSQRCGRKVIWKFTWRIKLTRPESTSLFIKDRTRFFRILKHFFFFFTFETFYVQQVWTTSESNSQVSGNFIVPLPKKQTKLLCRLKVWTVWF